MEALADSGASASITSWDLAKKLNMVVFGKGDDTLKNASHKHMGPKDQDGYYVEKCHIFFNFGAKYTNSKTVQIKSKICSALVHL